MTVILCKITKAAMIMAHGKKEDTLYMMSGFTASISIAPLDVDAGTWHPRLRHISKKRMKGMLSNGKLLELKSIDLDSVKTVSTVRRKKSVSRW